MWFSIRKPPLTLSNLKLENAARKCDRFSLFHLILITNINIWTFRVIWWYFHLYPFVDKYIYIIYYSFLFYYIPDNENWKKRGVVSSKQFKTRLPAQTISFVPRSLIRTGRVIPRTTFPRRISKSWPVTAFILLARLCASVFLADIRSPFVSSLFRHSV